MSEWTVDTLKEHFDALRKDDQDAVTAALAASEKAIEKRDVANEKRFDGVNEFRRALTDQTSTFVSRIEFNALKERMDRNDGKSSGLSAGWGYIVGAGGLVAAIVTIAAVLVTRQPAG